MHFICGADNTITLTQHWPAVHCGITYRNMLDFGFFLCPVKWWDIIPDTTTGISRHATFYHESKKFRKLSWIYISTAISILILNQWFPTFFNVTWYSYNLDTTCVNMQYLLVTIFTLVILGDVYETVVFNFCRFILLTQLFFSLIWNGKKTKGIKTWNFTRIFGHKTKQMFSFSD